MPKLSTVEIRMEEMCRAGTGFQPEEKVVWRKEWRVDVEDEIERQKKLDEQRKKLQKDL